MENIWEGKKRVSEHWAYLNNLQVEWYEHIWPLLQRAPRLSWVNGQANNGHGISRWLPGSLS